MFGRTFAAIVLAVGIAGGLGLSACGSEASTSANNRAGAFPDAATDEARPTQPGEHTLVVAGGCFWGIQAVFQHVKGVTSAISGYSGGEAGTAEYEVVSSGTTGHAESVKITYDPSQVSLGQILKVFFSVAHDPTEHNRQGPDTGTQYRSAIFYANDEQKRVAEAYIRQLNEAGMYTRPIATEVSALKGFYEAEHYHQNYATIHPDSPYISRYDLPKVASLEKHWPELYVAKPALK